MDALCEIFSSKFPPVIPDFPGHGKSISDISLDYSINAQAERLHEFLATFGIKRVHLIGNSIGRHYCNPSGSHPAKSRCIPRID